MTYFRELPNVQYQSFLSDKQSSHDYLLVKNIFRRPFKGTPDNKITTRINIKDTLNIKTKALMCHTTQNKDWQRYISRMKEEKNSGFEFYVLVNSGRQKKNKLKADLFE